MSKIIFINIEETSEEDKNVMRNVYVIFSIFSHKIWLITFCWRHRVTFTTKTEHTWTNVKVDCGGCLSVLASQGSFRASIGRLVFRVTRQFCVGCVTVFVFSGVIERDIYIFLGLQSGLWFTVFCFLSQWLPVYSCDGSANQQAALQLLRCPPFTWER